ncbi:MAG: rhodanese-like domain-containing protein [Flavobacteriales bacterium]|nr:rhodanese-like domain-containing protein [Flavobacteriales bacterium]
MTIIKTLPVLAIGLLLSCAGNAEKANETVHSEQNVVPESDQVPTVARDIAVDAFEQGIASADIQLIDVRTDEEYAAGHIDGAKQIDFYKKGFAEEIALLDKEKPVYVYCRSGGRSGQAMSMMRDMGFREVYNLAGGMNSWQGSGKPVAR